MCVRLSKERNSESVYTQIYDIVSIFNRKCSRAMIQCQVCHPDTSAQNGKVPDPQGYKCKSGGCNFVIGDCGLNPSTELKRYTYVLFYSLGKAQFALAQWFDLSAATTYQWIGLSRNSWSTSCRRGLRKSESTGGGISWALKKQKMAFTSGVKNVSMINGPSREIQK